MRPVPQWLIYEVVTIDTSGERIAVVQLLD
jgi:hypothetical protein